MFYPLWSEDQHFPLEGTCICPQSRGETPGDMGVKHSPSNDEKVAICGAIFLAPGIFVGQFWALGI